MPQNVPRNFLPEQQFDPLAGTTFHFFPGEIIEVLVVIAKEHKCFTYVCERESRLDRLPTSNTSARAVQEPMK